MRLTENINIGKMQVENRLVMPPMCMYQAKENSGKVNSFHLGHYTARAIGGVGLIIVESTGVSPNGRITNQCLGLWEDDQIPGMKSLVDAVHDQGSKIALQINHAGRKSETTNLRHIGPSAIEFNNQELTYEEASLEDIDQVIESFKQAAQRADKAGFDALEIHAAHGYLIHQFVSPISNKRTDAYGENRFLLLDKIIDEVKSVWPKDKPLWIRISTSDYLEGGLKVQDWIDYLNTIKEKIDLVHVSAGAIVNVRIDAYPGYMLDFAREIKKQTGLTTIGVGLLNNQDIIDYALKSDACDLVACGRELLRNPNLIQEIYKSTDQENRINKSYKRAY